MGEIWGEKDYVLDTEELKEWSRILEEPIVHPNFVNSSANICHHSKFTEGLAQHDLNSRVGLKLQPHIGKERSLGVREAAQVLGCSAKALHRLCDEGRLSFHWVGSRRKFRTTDLDEFWEGQRQNATYRERMLKKLTAARPAKSERRDLKGTGQASRRGSPEETKEVTLEDMRALCRT